MADSEGWATCLVKTREERSEAGQFFTPAPIARSSDTPISRPCGPTQWLFQGPATESKFLDGSTHIIERLGNIKHQTASSITVLASLSVESHANMKNGQRVDVSGFGGNFARECGLLGLALVPEFAKTGFVYLVYSAKNKLVNRLSRFTFKSGCFPAPRHS